MANKWKRAYLELAEVAEEMIEARMTDVVMHTGTLKSPKLADWAEFDRRMIQAGPRVWLAYKRLIRRYRKIERLLGNENEEKK